MSGSEWRTKENEADYRLENVEQCLAQRDSGETHNQLKAFCSRLHKSLGGIIARAAGCHLGRTAFDGTGTQHIHQLGRM